MTMNILSLLECIRVNVVPDTPGSKGAGTKTGDNQQQLSLESLAARLQKLEDTLAIQQLQSQYAYWLFTQEYKKIADHCFAQRAAGVGIEFSDSGVYQGIEGVRRILTAFEATRSLPGFFTMHLTVNPYIVIAQDGESAKSVWMSPGAAGNHASARWIWGPYYVDYVREDGRWKIKYTVFAPLFRNRYEHSWVEETDHGSVRGPFANCPPDAPPTLYRPYDKDQVDLFRDYPGLPEQY